MQTMVLEVLIDFGLCVVAEVAFQIADSFDCRQRKLRRVRGERLRRRELGINIP